MQHHATLELMRMALRVQVCNECYQRPPGSETLSPAESRVCEEKCGIFMNLPRLAGMVACHGADQPCGYEMAVRNLICQKCKSAPTAGDFCVENLTRNCPLSRYAPQVIAVLQRVADTQHRTH